MVLVRAVQTPTVSEQLWANTVDDGVLDLTFALCATHWLDLSYLSGIHAYQSGREEWFDEATTLLHQITRAAQWDPKEISNMARWQRVLLT